MAVPGFILAQHRQDMPIRYDPGTHAGTGKQRARYTGNDRCQITVKLLQKNFPSGSNLPSEL